MQQILIWSTLIMAAKIKSIHGAKKSGRLKSLFKLIHKLKLRILRSRLIQSISLLKIKMVTLSLKASYIKKLMLPNQYGKFKLWRGKLISTLTFRRQKKKFGTLSLLEIHKLIQPKWITAKSCKILMIKHKELLEKLCTNNKGKCKAFPQLIRKSNMKL